MACTTSATAMKGQMVMDNKTEDSSVSDLCTKGFQDDLQFLLVRHFGSSWEFKYTDEEKGFNMNVWAWKGEK